MNHEPIYIQNISLSFDEKICFQNFSSKIYFRRKIAIIGRNGTGKSSLLKIISGKINPTEGNIQIPYDVQSSYVPQIIENNNTLSGGQRFLKSFSQALSNHPNLLLLDEPTNHLDRNNKESLLKLLERFQGTLIIVSHDEELLKTCIDTIWNIEDGKVNIFSGRYEDYIFEQKLKQEKSINTFSNLKKEQKKARSNLQFEQERAAQRGKINKKVNERTRSLKNKMKDTASKTAGRNKRKILENKNQVENQLKSFTRPEIIKPTFTLTSKSISLNKPLVSIVDGSIRYQDSSEILNQIFLSVGSRERVLISGPNGSGKTTIIKAILDHPNIIKKGEWITPDKEDIGYLDQQYKTLDRDQSVYDNIKNIVPDLPEREIRKILSTFLFRKNEDVKTLVKDLSGGEKARLSLAQISVKTPRLLILDEVTNNLDINTKEYVLQVLKEYPGALIIISHDKEFIKHLGIDSEYKV